MDFCRSCSEALGTGFFAEFVERDGDKLSASILSQKPDIVICNAFMQNLDMLGVIKQSCDVLSENRGFKPLHLELQEPGNKAYHQAAGDDRSDLAGNIGSCSVHENDISGIFLHGHFLDDS